MLQLVDDTSSDEARAAALENRILILGDLVAVVAVCRRRPATSSRRGMSSGKREWAAVAAAHSCSARRG